MSGNSSTRRFSPVLIRYISAGFLVPFICSILVFVALFLLMDVLDNVGEFIEKGVPLQKTMLYYIALQPGNLVNVIPVGVLLGTSFLTMTLGRSNELTAMRASGLSLAACAMPVWVSAVVSALLVFAINESWGAACRRKASEIYYGNVKSHRIEKRFSFRNSRDYRDWSMDSVTEKGLLTGVIVRQYTEDGKNKFMAAAAKAERKEDGWLFMDGFIQHYADDGLQLKGSEFFDSRKLDFSENINDLEELRVDSELLNISALRRTMKNPFVTSRRAIVSMQVLVWHRLTLPLASLVAALFAFSLTISTERKGAVKGFAVAVAMLVLFYISGQIGLTLGRGGYVSPFVGGALPHLFFLFASAYSMYRRQ